MSLESLAPTVRLRVEPDCLAPDGSEIRLLASTSRGSMVHCTLPPGQTSLPVAHRQVEEIWYVLSGEGEVWRASRAEPESVRAGMSLSIPPRTAFQFRNTGPAPLCIVIVTMPPWPGADEAEPAAGYWPVTVTDK